MSSYGELSEHDRMALTKPIRDRIQRTEHPGWRRFWEAEVLFIEGDSVTATAALREIANSGDADLRAAALLRLGDLLRESSDFTAALEMFIEAEKYSDKPAFAIYSQAEAHLQLGNQGEAVRLLAEAIRRASRPTDIHWLRSAVKDYLGICSDVTAARITLAEDLSSVLSAEEVRELLSK